MEKVPALEIPVYFCCGVHNYTVNYGLSKVYWERLKAPVKGFYTFPNAAHCPMHEEPERFRRIMAEDVLSATTGLSDP